jgi:hypothetical protein
VPRRIVCRAVPLRVEKATSQLRLESARENPFIYEGLNGNQSVQSKFKFITFNAKELTFWRDLESSESMGMFSEKWRRVKNWFRGPPPKTKTKTKAQPQKQKTSPSDALISLE